MYMLYTFENTVTNNVCQCITQHYFSHLYKYFKLSKVHKKTDKFLILSSLFSSEVRQTISKQFKYIVS